MNGSSVSKCKIRRAATHPAGGSGPRWPRIVFPSQPQMQPVEPPRRNNTASRSGTLARLGLDTTLIRRTEDDTAAVEPPSLEGPSGAKSTRMEVRAAPTSEPSLKLFEWWDFYI